MRMAVAAALLATASPAVAAVEDSTPSGFTVRNRAVVAAPPVETWAMLGRIGDWWSDEHSYSGKAANMRLELEAGGCFCETVPARFGGPAGGVEHGRVLTVLPYEFLVLDAPLGPLQTQAMLGRLSWTLRGVEGGTEVTQTFVAAGYVKDGADKLAPLVDKVLGQQLEALKRRLER